MEAFEALGKLLFIFLIIVIVIYVAIAIFLNNFNKLVNGKGTALAWIPICNIYLLGKLTFNKMVGWILVACCFALSTVTVTVNGESTTHTLLPDSIAPTVSKLYNVVTLIILVMAVIKYNKLKKGTQQPAQPMMQQPQAPGYPQQPVQPQVPGYPEPVQPQAYPQQPMQPQAQTYQQPTQNVNNGQNNNMM